MSFPIIIFRRLRDIVVNGCVAAVGSVSYCGLQAPQQGLIDSSTVIVNRDTVYIILRSLVDRRSAVASIYRTASGRVLVLTETLVKTGEPTRSRSFRPSPRPLGYDQSYVFSPRVNTVEQTKRGVSLRFTKTSR